MYRRGPEIRVSIRGLRSISFLSGSNVAPKPLGCMPCNRRAFVAFVPPTKAFSQPLFWHLPAFGADEHSRCAGIRGCLFFPDASEALLSSNILNAKAILASSKTKVPAFSKAATVLASCARLSFSL